jgi:two-component system, OmpR family, phosphate regulon response regulator OmpR
MSHLLLLDDDRRLTEMVSGYLRNNGFEVSTAGSLASSNKPFLTRCCWT